MTTNSQADWRTVNCSLHVKIPQTETDHHWSPAQIEMGHHLKITFHAEMWICKPATLWLTHACVRGHSALTPESSGQYQRDDVASAKQLLLKKNSQTINNVLHFDASCPIRVYFRWPCLSIVFGGWQEWSRFCQFLWDSAEQTVLPRNTQIGWSRGFPLVYTCVCYFIKNC